MKRPTDAELRNARTDFRDLLSRTTSEAIWQSFFSAHPFVLSRSLPLRLLPCDIVPLGRRGRSEPDFLICPGSKWSVPNMHGLVEIKTPSARVTTIVRRNVLSLTRDAAGAIRQVQVYDRDYDTFCPPPIKRCISFSSASHLFVIMGSQGEIGELCRRPDLLPQLNELIPGNVRFLGFDELLGLYESTGIPLRSFVLAPDLPAGPRAAVRVWSLLTVGAGDQQYAGHLGYADDPQTVYRYDSQVQNHLNVRPGDLALIRGCDALIGLAVIEQVRPYAGTKRMLRCPQCRTGGLKERQQRAPRFRCARGHEFETPSTERVEVTLFEAHYGRSYTEAPEAVPVAALKAAALRPSDQMAIEELDLTRLQQSLGSAFPRTRERFSRFLQSVQGTEPADALVTADSGRIIPPDPGPWLISVADSQPGLVRVDPAGARTGYSHDRSPEDPFG